MKLIFRYRMKKRPSFFFSHMYSLLIQHHLLKRLFSIALQYHFYHNSSIHVCMHLFLISAFYSVMDLAIRAQNRTLLITVALKISLNAWCSNTYFYFLLFNLDLPILGFLHLHTNFRIHLSISTHSD